MRMSCNGCRVLRKGCSENCSIRPCLQWIKNPESQANATVFLAKFYGRAGLMNLINAGPDHLRPAIFRSLLYEACGRIVNPIYGSVGLLWSGSWQLCQAAVEAVLKGAPIMQVPSETASNTGPPLKAYDVRHVSKEETSASLELHKVKTRSRFKRSAKPKPNLDSAAAEFVSEPTNPDSNPVFNLRWRRCYPDGFNLAASHESSESQQSEPNAEGGDSRETESMFSVETIEASMVRRAETEPQPDSRADDSEPELELRLGLEPVSHASRVKVAHHMKTQGGFGGDRFKVELGVDSSA
ncbi:LOB domain-containing protein 41-like [Tasmannia lanceolata]|uniref:LOB domain-containing protein 41-like n=1 Tax=Tasmannia lanceolata TaxID=3420 RepID=UPI00406388C4